MDQSKSFISDARKRYWELREDWTKRARQVSHIHDLKVFVDRARGSRRVYFMDGPKCILMGSLPFESNLVDLRKHTWELHNGHYDKQTIDQMVRGMEESDKQEFEKEYEPFDHNAAHDAKQAIKEATHFDLNRGSA